jgi:hypothetical protein
VTRTVLCSMMACLVAGSIGAVGYAADVLAQLGIPVLAAREATGTAISNGLYNPGLPSQAFKLLSPAARAEAATAGVAWLKIYTASPEFKQQYARIRETHKPAAPQFDGTPEDELKREAEEQKRQAEESKKALASLPLEQRQAVEQALQASAAELAQMDSPEARKMRLEAIATARTELLKQHELNLANWNRSYPEHPAPAIARRLREFLVMSADVDFGAKLTAQETRMLFENPAYQAKGSQWKLCYRAGREATMAARAAVTAWLKELEPAGR